MLRSIILLIFSFIIFSPLTAQEVKFEGLKEINGTHLFVKVIGEGEPILVIHGGPGLNHNYFLPHLEKLAKKYQLIFYDQRSAGQSDLSVHTEVNIKKFAEDIEAIRKEFNIDKLNILCHSWSSIITSEYLILYPDHVKSVVFCNPSPLNHEYNNKMNETVMARIQDADSVARANIISSDAFKQGDLATVNALMKLNIKAAFCDTANIRRFDAKLPDNYLVASLSLQGLMFDMKSLNLYDQLKNANVQAPVLIMSGTCDIIPSEAMSKLAACFPQVKQFTFEHSGHYPFIEETKVFTKQVSKFMKHVN